MKPLSIFLIIISMIAFNCDADSQVRPVHIFDNNMVLQRDKKVKIWGLATPQEKIRIEFAKQVKLTVANKEGEWFTYLDPMPANAKPGIMKISGKSNSVSYANVLVGDVWVLGGQSNMELDLSELFHGDVEVQSANFPNIRLMTIPSSSNVKPQKDFKRINEYDAWNERFDKKGYWFNCSPATVRTFSGLGYLFGKRIHMASQVPIGLIDASLGGTTLEAWLSTSTLSSIPENDSLLKQWDDKVTTYDPQEQLKKQIARWEKYNAMRIAEGHEAVPKPTEPTPSPVFDRNFPASSYNGMISVFEGLSVKGAIFHHGYNNALDDSRPKQYALNFKALISDWRKAFADEKLPFGIIELSAGGEPQTLENYESSMLDPAPYIREAQFGSYRELSNIGFVCSYDQQVNFYHPQKKAEAAERMARWALSTQYGQQFAWEPALCVGVEKMKDKIILSFSKEIKSSDDRAIEGFAIATTDQHFVPAKATYLKTKNERGQTVDDKTKIVISNSLIENPLEVRYAWARNPLGNLVNQDSPLIPVPSFRSDSWDYPAAPYPPEEYDAHRAKLKLLRKQAQLNTEQRLVAEAQEFLKNRK